MLQLIEQHGRVYGRFWTPTPIAPFFKHPICILKSRGVKNVKLPLGKFSCQCANGAHLWNRTPARAALSSPCNWSCILVHRSASKHANARAAPLERKKEPLLTIFNVAHHQCRVFSLLFFQLLPRSEIKFDNNKVESSGSGLAGVASQDDVVKHSLELQQTSALSLRSVSFPNGSLASAGAKMDGLFGVSAPWMMALIHSRALHHLVCVQFSVWRLHYTATAAQHEPLFARLLIWRLTFSLPWYLQPSLLISSTHHNCISREQIWVGVDVHCSFFLVELEVKSKWKQKRLLKVLVCS